jgi:hypothetical protein
MDIVLDSVKKVESLLEHSGCAEGDVLLDVNPDAKNCQFEKGACMTASFGGRVADFVTYDPIRAMTKISFMFDAPLDTPATRSAAAVIVNAVMGFFCMTRVLHACPESAHASCLAELKREIGGRRVFCQGTIPVIEREFGDFLVSDPADAEIILVNGEGVITEGTGDLVERDRDSTPVLFLGSSAAGVARLHEVRHWCPYGKP